MSTKIGVSPAERMAVTFARVLRGAGLLVPIGNVLMFVEALGRVGIDERDHVYWAARSTLVHRPEDVTIFDRAFAVFWEHGEVESVAEDPDTVKVTLATDDESDDDTDASGEASDDPTVTLRFSPMEVLRNKDFGAYDETELILAQQLMSRLKFAGPPRRSFRFRPAQSGSRPDLRATLRTAISAGGEPIRRFWQEPGERMLRPLMVSDFTQWTEVRQRNEQWLTPWEPLRVNTTSDPTRHRDAFSSRCATRDRERQVGTGYGFGLFVGDAFAGEININNVVRGAFQCGVVGYWIDERHAGNRYVAEGVVVLCRFAFDELHLHRLEICIVPRNTKSRRVMGLVFSEEQGSFLVGAAAALKSKTGQVGYIGGVSGLGGLLEKFEAGFTAGAKAANPNIKVIAKYISAAPDVTGFNSPDKARDIANAMYAGGADIIYAAAGGAGAGVFEAAKATSDSSGSKVWAIGVDSDQYNTADPAVKDFILTSMAAVAHSLRPPAAYLRRTAGRR